MNELNTIQLSYRAHGEKWSNARPDSVRTGKLYVMSRLICMKMFYWLVYRQFVHTACVYWLFIDNARSPLTAMNSTEAASLLRRTYCNRCTINISLTHQSLNWGRGEILHRASLMDIQNGAAHVSIHLNWSVCAIGMAFYVGFSLFLDILWIHWFCGISHWGIFVDDVCA